MELKGAKSRRNRRYAYYFIYLVWLTAHLEKGVWFFLLPDVVQSPNDKVLVFFLGVVFKRTLEFSHALNVSVCNMYYVPRNVFLAGADAN